MTGSALIVEDHPLFRDALTALMQGVFGEAATLAAASAEEGLRCAAQANDLRLVLLDMGLPGLSGLEAVGAFRRACPDTAIVAVSASEDRREVDAALRLGVRAFVSKAMPTEAIVGVVQRVLRDATSPPEWVKPRPRAELAPTLPELTPRQREILALLCDGHGNKEIGLRLSLAENTVKQHVSALFRALGVVNRTQAVLVARHLGVAPAAPDDDAPLPEVLAELHTTLYSLGRLTEADEVFHRIESMNTDLLLLAGVTGTQVRSLASRSRYADGLALGMAMLGRLGIEVPPDPGADLESRLDARMKVWSAIDPDAELLRAEATDRGVLAAAELINDTAVCALYCGDRAAFAWLVLESDRLWETHGPCSWLVATRGATPAITLQLRDDYRIGYDIARSAIAVGEAHGWEPGTSRAMHCIGVFGQHYHVSLEDVLVQSRQVRERLLHHGDQQWACFTHNTVATALIDSAPSLDACLAEVEEAIAIALRSGNEHLVPSLRAFEEFARVLRGDMAIGAGASITPPAMSAVAAARVDVYRALVAALLGDSASLAHHMAAALDSPGHPRWSYRHAALMLLHALMLADRARAANAIERTALLSEFDACHMWFEQRAISAPANYEHLVLWLDAESAWARDKTWVAEGLFDSALLAVEGRTRPWHRALATERAACLQRELGHERAARRLLAEARDLYAAWGVHGKVEAMRREHDFLCVDHAVAR